MIWIVTIWTSKVDPGKLDDAELLYPKLTTVLASLYGPNSPETLSAAPGPSWLNNLRNTWRIWTT